MEQQGHDGGSIRRAQQVGSQVQLDFMANLDSRTSMRLN
jgi:hypothetical protein